MRPILSVIMPVYNTSRYLKESINSILNQKIDNIEFIIVNDGSTDESENVIKSIMSENKNIMYFYQENSGQGAARNLGISYATGKYIYFMDSDDILKENTFLNLINLLENKTLDAIFFDGEDFLDIIDNNLNKLTNTNYHKKESYGYYENGQDLWLDFINKKEFNVSPCLYIVKREILIENNLFFFEGIIHEDQIFTTKLYFFINRCLHINEIYFLRRVRSNSTMTSNKQLDKLYAYITIFKELYKFAKKYTWAKIDIKKAFFRYLSEIAVIINVLSNELDSDRDELEKIRKIVKNDKSFSIKAKLSFFNLPLYIMLGKVSKKLKRVFK